MTLRPPLRDRLPLPDHGATDELQGFVDGAPGWLAATVKFCSRCGTRLDVGPVDGEHRDRAACVACGFIAYINPRLVVTTIPVLDDGRVMLLRRAIEPGYGAWAQPGGFLEADETAIQGAVRETQEETGLEVEPAVDRRALLPAPGRHRRGRVRGPHRRRPGPRSPRRRWRSDRSRPTPSPGRRSRSTPASGRCPTGSARPTPTTPIGLPERGFHNG